MYVGKTVSTNLNRYLSVKRWAARHNRTNGMRLIRAMAKYGVDSFTTSILAVASSVDELHTLERLWIIALNARDPRVGYNLLAGGNGAVGRVCTAEHKRKIGEANRGRKPVGYVRTEVHRQQLRDRMTGNTRGVRFTTETARAASAALTPEQRKERGRKGAIALWKKRGYPYVEAR